MSKLTFYYTDSCPFAQRTWIALLEKNLSDEVIWKEVPLEFRFPPLVFTCSFLEIC